MKKWAIRAALLCSCFMLTGCGAASYDGVPSDEPFVATVNQLEPSITFFNERFDVLTEWALDEPYTGATLLHDDMIALYGMGVPYVAIYELASGKQIEKINTELGNTNVLYSATHDELYVTNKEQNTIIAYTRDGSERAVANVGKYPMSMQQFGNELYVLNFKSSYLSVINIDTFDEIATWNIPSSSNGLLINKEQQELWIGGHGEHTTNEHVLVLDLQTGDVVKEIAAPEMPVALAQSADEISVISHGSNVLHQFTKQGDKIREIEIGANPFAVAYFQQTIVTAGYDDNTLYVMDDAQITAYETGDGPFQLIVRE